MKNFLILFLFSILFNANVIAQRNYDSRTETNTHIYWQPDRVLTKEDFQGDGSSYEKSRLFCDSLDMCTMAFLGYFKILDIPKKEKDRGLLLEIAYFAPMFEKNTSYILDDKDPLGVAKQQVIFDIYEVFARMTRRKFKELYKELGAEGHYGVLSIMFTTTTGDFEKKRKDIVGAYSREVYIEKKDSAYYQWRELVDEGLSSLSEYATTIEDCERAIKGKPLDKRYITPEFIMGNLFEDED